MNRYQKIQTAFLRPTRFGAIYLLIAASALWLASAGLSPAMAAGTAASKADPNDPSLEGDYLEPGDGPTASEFDHLLYFSRQVTQAFASRTWSNEPTSTRAENDWFNLRSPERDQTDTTVVPIRERGSFGGLMLNVEVKY